MRRCEALALVVRVGLLLDEFACHTRSHQLDALPQAKCTLTLAARSYRSIRRLSYVIGVTERTGNVFLVCHHQLWHVELGRMRAEKGAEIL